ncbi:MAG: imidazole glycerol phosphate synthase subunit HisH [Candidatus Omnitrophota bacterium]|nr:imidazole glycerol phosphate synthase subunit HisH [Candidatus Omnitrophota bacterium]
MNSPIVSIIDYGMGNLFSVNQACSHVGIQARITAKKEDILNSDAAILPGVGAFGDAMLNLEKLGLISPILDFVKSAKPFMGICLGMQLLFSESEEFGIHKGLNIIPGRVVRFTNNSKEKAKVPQVGWNRISNPSSKRNLWQESPLSGINKGEFMYFVHSFYCIPENKEIILSNSKYSGTEYASSILVKNIFASQFHPEKSGNCGLKIYKNFKKTISKEDAYE